MDRQRVSRLRGSDKLALPYRQQIVFPHQPQHPFVIDVESALLQLDSDPAIAIAAPVLESNPLHLGSQLHILLYPVTGFQPTIKSGPAHACQSAHMLDTQTALQRHHLPDLLVDTVAPEVSLFWRRASIFCKAPLKKSTSRLFCASSCWVCRSCFPRLSFSRSGGAQASTAECDVIAFRQRYSLSRGRPSSLANALMLELVFIRSSAICRNSGV